MHRSRRLGLTALAVLSLVLLPPRRKLPQLAMATLVVALPQIRHHRRRGQRVLRVVLAHLLWIRLESGQRDRHQSLSATTPCRANFPSALECASQDPRACWPPFLLPYLPLP